MGDVTFRIHLSGYFGFDLKVEALHRCSNYHVVYDVGDTEELGKSIADELCMEFYDFEDYINWDDFVEDHVSGEYAFFNGDCIMEN